MTVWIWAFPTVVAGGQVLAIALFFLTGQERVEQSAVRYLKSTMSHPTLFFFTTVTIALLVPVIEEFLFRGLLQNALRRLCGGKGAVIVTAFVFGLFHFTPGQGSGNVEIIGSLVLLSLFLGFSYERTASLWTPIGLHSAYNAMTILFLALDQDVPL